MDPCTFLNPKHPKEEHILGPAQAGVSSKHGLAQRVCGARTERSQASQDRLLRGQVLDRGELSSPQVTLDHTFLLL